ncbi:MAG: HVO_A0114 family putative DNA-binding protein [Candidatus Brocadiales bacterium]
MRIGIKSTKEVLQDFVKTCETIERGEKVKKKVGVYFEDVEALRKFLTTKRLERLRLIKKHYPKTLHHLSMLAERNIKNVAQDVKLLKDLGLVSTKQQKDGKKEVTPTVDYDAIELLITV